MKNLTLIAIFISAFVLSACGAKENILSDASILGDKGKTYSYPQNERACLERAIFFEANRSSREGMIAVGNVVMNRVNSSAYPNTICGVVGQKNQFAPGVLTRPMNSAALPDVREAADAVLKGERHPKIKNAMFFHTAGLNFPYKNMHYVLVAGGNSFYEKRARDGSLQVPTNDQPYDRALAFAQSGEQASVASETVVVENAVEAVQQLGHQDNNQMDDKTILITQKEADAIGAALLERRQ